MMKLGNLKWTLVTLQSYLIITISLNIHAETTELGCDDAVYAYLNQPDVRITCKIETDAEHVSVTWLEESDDAIIVRALVEAGETEHEVVISVEIDRVTMNHFTVYSFKYGGTGGWTTFNVTLKEKAETPREELLWCTVHRSVEAEAWDYDRELELQRHLEEVFHVDPSLCAAPCDGQCYNVGRCSALQASIAEMGVAQPDAPETDVGTLLDQRCMTQDDLSLLMDTTNTADSCLSVTEEILTLLYGEGVTSLFNGRSRVNGTLCFCDHHDQCNTPPSQDDDNIYTSFNMFNVSSVSQGHLPVASYLCVILLALAAGPLAADMLAI